MEKFKSKIDLWFIILLGLIFGAVLVRSVVDKNWIAFGIILLVVIFIIHMFSTTLYIVKDKKVVIKCGYFFNKAIEIQNIRKISESHNVISSPALSFDRIEILYNKFDTILISPKEKKKFIETIKNINPEVEFRGKN